MAKKIRRGFGDFILSVLQNSGMNLVRTIDFVTLNSFILIYYGRQHFTVLRASINLAAMLYCEQGISGLSIVYTEQKYWFSRTIASVVCFLLSTVVLDGPIALVWLTRKLKNIITFGSHRISDFIDLFTYRDLLYNSSVDFKIVYCSFVMWVSIVLLSLRWKVPQF